MQKPPFCTPKTILLQCKNHAFVLRICNVHRMNTLQTFREYPHSPTKTPNLHPAKYNEHPKTPNLHTARRRGRFIVPVSLHNQIYIFTLSNPYIHFIAHVCPHFKIRIFKSPHTYIRSSFCGCFHICGHDKSAPTAACVLP